MPGGMLNKNNVLDRVTPLCSINYTQSRIKRSVIGISITVVVVVVVILLTLEGQN